MKIESAVREYSIEIEVGKYTPWTIKGYRNNLNLFLRFCKETSMIEDVAIAHVRRSRGGAAAAIGYFRGAGRLVRLFMKTGRSWHMICSSRCSRTISATTIRAVCGGA